MLRATWKSLLARKLRLLLSTFAIVLGVAFVAGTLIFTDTLSRSFTAIFASSVGDVVVTPNGAQTQDGTPTDKTVPASLVRKLATADGAASADGNVSSLGVFVVDQHGKLVGGNGPPGIAVNYNTAPAGHGVEGLSIVSGTPPKGPDEVALDARTAKSAGYHVGDRIRLTSSGSQDSLRPRLVGLADFRDGGSTNGATITIFDTATAQKLFLDGKDAYSDAWVTAKDGESQSQLRDQVADLLPSGYTAKTGDQAAEDDAAPVQEAVKFISIFLLIFAGIALVVGAFLIVNTFSILVAQRSRELALLRALGASRGAGHPVRPARGARARLRGRHHRARDRGAARDRHPVRLRDVRARPVRSAADLPGLDRADLLRHRHRRHLGRGVPPGPPSLASGAGRGPARRRRDARGHDAPAVRGGHRDAGGRCRLDARRAVHRRAEARLLGGRRHPRGAAGRDRRQPRPGQALPGRHERDLPAHVRIRGPAGRRERPSQPAAHGGDGLRVDGRSCARLDDGDRGCVVQGQPGQDDRRQLPGRPRGVERGGRAVLARRSPTASRRPLASRP